MPMPPEDRLEVAIALVDPAAGLADPVDPADQPLAVGAVFHVEAEGLGRERVDLLEVPDITLVLQDLRDASTHVRGGHIQDRALDPDGVADPG